MRTLKIALVTLLLTLPIAAREFTAVDLVEMPVVGTATLSPSGALAAYTLKTTDATEMSSNTDLWVVDMLSREARRLTTGTGSEHSPVFVDDDTLLFLSARSGSTQVYRIRLSGGEAEQITELGVDVDHLVLGPQGALFLGLMVYPDCDGDLACTTERLASESDRLSSGLVYDELMVRHWDTFRDHRRVHVHRLAATEKGWSEPVDLMPGVDADCPTIPWGDAGDFAISADGKTLIYTAKVLPGSEEAWSTNWDLWTVPTDGSTPARKLTSNPAWDQAPRFSPDGSQLAWLAMTVPDYEADRNRVMVMDWPEGQPKALTEAWDRSPSELVWAADSQSLLAVAPNLGAKSIFRIDFNGGVNMLTFKRYAYGLQSLPDDGLLYAESSLVSPTELYTAAADGSGSRRLSEHTKAAMAELDMPKIKQLRYTGAKGDEIHAWFLEPPNRAADTKVPLVLVSHGGPQGSSSNRWHPRWNLALWSAQGWAILAPDFHGSTGYGQAFTDAINQDWAITPAADLMLGIDYALAHTPWLDGERLGAAGGSYGGFMMNWLQGTTDRFDALVCHSGNIDETAAYFMTEELWFPEYDHGGTPWKNPSVYAEQSPLAHIEDWKTPELVIHGQLDYRVVVTQGLATFNALRRQGVPARLLYFPDEDHWVAKPANRLQWHEEVFGWLDKWMK